MELDPQVVYFHETTMLLLTLMLLAWVGVPVVATAVLSSFWVYLWES
jgi:hypothetical protein